MLYLQITQHLPCTVTGVVPIKRQLYNLIIPKRFIVTTYTYYFTKVLIHTFWGRNLSLQRYCTSGKLVYPKRYNFQCSTVLLMPNFLVLFKELNGLLYTSKLWTVASEEIETVCVPLRWMGMLTNIFIKVLQTSLLWKEAGDWRSKEKYLPHFHVLGSRADTSPVESAPNGFSHKPFRCTTGSPYAVL